MPVERTAVQTTASRSAGRAFFWIGLGLIPLGIVLFVVQYNLGRLFVPWYVPILTTIGAGFLLYSIVRRWTIVRTVALVFVVAFGCFEWFAIGMGSRLPDYQGPAQAGRAFPVFSTTLSRGRPFTSVDLGDGTPTVMVFFRGRW